jgi:hypothetical protein
MNSADEGKGACWPFCACRCAGDDDEACSPRAGQAEVAFVNVLLIN